MTEKTFLFYDLETTGLNKAFDQVVQFAAIRTDQALQELDRVEIRIALSPDTVPSPMALLTHHIDLATMCTGDSEYEGIQQIYQLLNAPGTCSVGYNTLGFDDEFLRFSFYRNLLPAYTHQYANNCSRLDIYPLVLFYYLYAPDCLQWPEKDGKVSFKLDALNQKNAWVDGPAHDAMVDVEATLALARVLKQKTAMWDYLAGHFDKKTELERLQALADVAVEDIAGRQWPRGLFLLGRLGHKRSFQSAVLGLGEHKHYKNQSLWLRLDTLAFTEFDTREAFIQAAPYLRKKLTEPGFILPKKARFNRLNEQSAMLVEANLSWLAEHGSWLQALSDQRCQAIYPVIDHLDPSAALYQGGFVSSHDQALSQQFHALAGDKQAALIDNFKDGRIRQLAMRIIGRLDPALLTADHHANFSVYLDSLQGESVDAMSAAVDFHNKPRYTWHDCFAEVEQLLEESQDLSDKDRGLLGELAAYGASQACEPQA